MNIVPVTTTNIRGNGIINQDIQNAYNAGGVQAPQPRGRSGQRVLASPYIEPLHDLKNDNQRSASSNKGTKKNLSSVFGGMFF